MCIDLYVDKVLVYTDCVPSPVPSPVPNVPSPVHSSTPRIVPSPSIVPSSTSSPVPRPTPSPVPSPSIVPSSTSSPVPSPSIVPSSTLSPVFSTVPSIVSTVPSPVPSSYIISNVPSVTSPATNVIIDGYSLVTPSANTRTNTTTSPSSSNSNMSVPFGENGSEFIHTENWTTTLGIVAATVLPTLLICILAYKKKPKKCKKIPNKVQPEMIKKKKTRFCGCCKKKTKLPDMKPYENQPPLPLSEPVEESLHEPSAPPISLPPTPKGT